MQIEYIHSVSTTGPEPVVVVESVNRATKRRLKRCRRVVSVFITAAPFVFCFVCGALTVELARYQGLIPANSHHGKSASGSNGFTPTHSNMPNVGAEHTSTANESNSTTHRTAPTPPAPTVPRLVDPATPPQMARYPMGELGFHFREQLISCPWKCSRRTFHEDASLSSVVVTYGISRVESEAVIALKPLLVTVYRFHHESNCSCQSSDFYHEVDESPSPSPPPPSPPPPPPPRPPSPPRIPPEIVDNNGEYVFPTPPTSPQQRQGDFYHEVDESPSPPRIPPQIVDNNDEYVFPTPPKSPQERHDNSIYRSVTYFSCVQACLNQHEELLFWACDRRCVGI